MNKTEQQQSLNDEVSLKELILKIQELWHFLLSKWIIILCAGIIGGLIGLAYSWTRTPIYKAELNFTLQDDKAAGSLSAKLGLASQLGIDLSMGSAGGEFSGDNLLALIKSRYIVTKALLTPVIINNKKTLLVERYIQFNDLRKGWKGKPGLENIQFSPQADSTKLNLQQDSILGVFHKALINNNLVVDKLDKDLSIISLKIGSPDELFSKFFCENLIKVVSDYYIETKTEKERKNVAILQKQTDSIRHILYGGISSIAQSADANPNPNASLQVLKVPTQRKQIEVQANGAILNELIKNLEIAKMSLLQETPLIQIIDKPVLPLEKERYSKLKGLILMSVIAGFATTLILTMSLIYKKIMQSE